MLMMVVVGVVVTHDGTMRYVILVVAVVVAVEYLYSCFRWYVVTCWWRMTMMMM